MNAKDFIIETLKSWEKKFSGIVVKYAYEEHTFYHVITVEPKELYLNNEEYNEAETEFWDDFQMKFPNENLLISEPNSCLTMNNLLYPITSVDAIVKQSKKRSIWFSCFTSNYSNIIRSNIEQYSYDNNTIPVQTDLINGQSIYQSQEYNYALAA